MGGAGGGQRPLPEIKLGGYCPPPPYPGDWKIMLRLFAGHLFDLI